VPVAGIHRSCCTSNAPDEQAFGRGIDTVRQLLLEAKNPSRQEGRAAVYSSPEDLFQRLLRDVRERLRSVFGLSYEDNISLFPSGTDAELMPSLLAVTRAVHNSGRGSAVRSVVVAAGEVGSGTLQASTGRDFAKRLPSGNAPDGSCVFPADGLGAVPGGSLFTGVSLFIRDASGRLLTPRERDEKVEAAVAAAAAERGDDGLPKYGCIVVHMVVGSKTGGCMPSKACLGRLAEAHGKLVVPVVDACQGRMGESDIREYLDKDWIVLCTGSKFFGGPPFSGACLMSGKLGQELESLLIGNSGLARMLAQSRLKEYVVAALVSDSLPTLRSLLPQRPLNYGVLMRWTLALHGMEAYYAEVPAACRIRLMQDWVRAVTRMVAETPGAFVELLQDQAEDGQDEQSTALSTIVCFHCRCNRGTPDKTADTMSMEELRHLQYMMASDLSQLRPQVGPPSVLKTRCFLGQPVELYPQPSGGPAPGMHVLRAAASAPLIVRAWHDGLESILQEDRAVFEKLQLVLANWFLLEVDSSP